MTIAAITATAAFAGLPRGVFTGPVDQPGSDPYSLTLEMNPGKLIKGKVAGTTDYPELECGGDLIFKKKRRGAFRFREELTFDNAGRCIDLGKVKLTPEGDGIIYRWTGGGERATASLRRG